MQVKLISHSLHRKSKIQFERTSGFREYYCDPKNLSQCIIMYERYMNQYYMRPGYDFQMPAILREVKKVINEYKRYNGIHNRPSTKQNRHK